MDGAREAEVVAASSALGAAANLLALEGLRKA